ncbi:unnamed protein product [Ectocarpus sp. 13 AM-2016]
MHVSRNGEEHHRSLTTPERHIPKELGSLRELQRLDLKRNYLSGK